MRKIILNKMFDNKYFIYEVHYTKMCFIYGRTRRKEWEGKISLFCA